MKHLFNDDWTFLKTPLGTDLASLDTASFAEVRIPHDWLIYNTDALYEDATGWYRKVFPLGKEYGKRYQIYFEGVYMDTTVYVNRREVGTWKYGYSSFFFDITDALEPGQNEILVRVDHQSPNTRWYSGAGIYRNVWLIDQEEAHFVTDSFYVSPKPRGMHGKQMTPETPLDGLWELRVSAEILGVDPDSDAGKAYSLFLQVPELDINVSFPLSECVRPLQDAVVEGAEEALPWRPQGEKPILAEVCIPIEHPELWSTEHPRLYMIGLSLKKGERMLDRFTADFGFRSFVFTTDRGFFLNGQHLKLNGVCQHHDLGALGSAYCHDAMKRQILILKEMGVNAIRTSHNMPAPDLLEIADKEGILLLVESFDMWRSPKTAYDYARFFPKWQARDVASWVRRDRNHACVVGWSIGNEIYDTHADPQAPAITRMLMEEVHSHDPYHNAEVTIGSNYMPWEGAQKCADVLKLAGYNYGEKYYEKHHAEHPDWMIYGSETSSTVQSRGIYHFPLDMTCLADDDEQCSALGNCTTSWGAPSAEYILKVERDTPYSAGQFLWSGFDYIGEPTPYSNRNSYFGQIDTAGFPKDTFYTYKSMWVPAEKDPFVHVYPYWDFNPGQRVDVRISSNLSDVELFVNGVSQGRKVIDHAHGEDLQANYSVIYEPGEIRAVGYDAQGKEVASDVRHSFGEAAAIRLERQCGSLGVMGNGEDLVFVEVTVVDKDGYPVENANNLIRVKVQGAGRLVGLDNGDSTDDAQYKGRQKRLFSGKLLLICRAENRPGAMTIQAESKGLEKAELFLQVLSEAPREGRSYATEVKNDLVPEDSVWVRKIELGIADSDQRPHFDAERRQITVEAKILPENADYGPEDLIWRTVTDTGIDSPIAKVVRREGNRAVIEAFGDGSFKVRCMTRNGQRVVKVISELVFTAEGLGQALLDPYGFIAGGIWTYHEGELGNGNEHGVSTARECRSVVGFEHVDFGAFGSDEITIPIFELGGEKVSLQIWEGIPEQEGSTLLADTFYHKPSIWNTYQAETYKLSKRLTGVTMICFVTQEKIHIGGFSFRRLEKAYEKLDAASCDRVYGDQFTKEEKAITGIGNNVSVDFGVLDFGEEGADSLTLEGFTPKEGNTIHLLIGEGENITREILEFPHADAVSCADFSIGRITGKKKIQFVFLPGSAFDFVSVQFRKAGER